MKKEFSILAIFFIMAITPLAIFFAQQQQTTQQKAQEVPTATPNPTFTPAPTQPPLQISPASVTISPSSTRQIYTPTRIPSIR